MKKLVSVITSTWNRRDTLLTRSIPSVQLQTYHNIEHIIVSDGQDNILKQIFDISKIDNEKFVELGRNWRTFSYGKSYGAIPRLIGTYMAKGDYIAYLDDDNEFLPFHIEKLVSLIEEKNADFVYSKMQIIQNGKIIREIGSVPPIIGAIDTSIILHKAELLNVANWRPSGYADDWDLVSRWLDNNAKYAFLNEVTMTYHK